MAFYQSSSFSDQNGYYYSQVPDHQDYYYSYYPPIQSYGCYEYLPSRPLVAYSPCNEATYTIPASTDHYQYAVYHSVAAPSSPDVEFVEYDSHPYRGGYDIDQTYGKPLSPSDYICYPRSSLAPNPPFPSMPPPSPSPGPAPQQEEDEDDDDEEELPPEFEEEEADDLKSESHVTEEVEQPSDDDDNDDGDGSEDGTSVGSVQVYQGVGEYNGRVVNQNPPGYGLEAFDLCENLFGYWPCLSKLKVNKRCDACGNENAVAADDVDQWKRTADYLFGNPDPYGEWADEGGYASGNPVNYAYHHHQVQYQHPAYTLYQQQPDQSSHNSWSL